MKFFANAAAANTRTETRASILPADFNAEPVHVTVPETGVYTANTLCIPPSLIGRRIVVRFSTADPDGGGCLATFASEVGFFDDIEITTDPSCPPL